MLYEVVRIAAITLCCVAAGLSAMNVLQAQRYQIPVLRRDLRRYADHFLRPNVIVAAAAALLNWYLPVLLGVSLLTGTLTGFVASLLFRAMKNIHFNR